MAGRGARAFATLSVTLLLTACGGGQEHAPGHPAPGHTVSDGSPKPLTDAVAATEHARTVTGTYVWETKGLPPRQGRFAIQRTPYAASARDGSESVIAVGGDGYKMSTAFGDTKWTKVALRPPGGNAAPGSPDEVSKKIIEIDSLANVRFFAAASKDFKTLGTDLNENGSTHHFSGAFLGLQVAERRKVRDTSAPDPRGPYLLEQGRFRDLDRRPATGPEVRDHIRPEHQAHRNGLRPADVDQGAAGGQDLTPGPDRPHPYGPSPAPRDPGEWNSARAAFPRWVRLSLRRSREARDSPTRAGRASAFRATHSRQRDRR
ncbi:hypothetical protein GCM10027176_66900 [Actinoallomurus bryophytorum]|uniref:Uncharacterized protein n=1 Tax=Actinoallomurus bryophytorum TaxID=1490222 RepID=A0A543BZ25_9ACTN|nr:hypothetical protein [Actinoallomurus bryophytorum]TQL90087.1 hypothetical protein FB559_7379 [Actinoallomurus bryophytorum]